MNERVKLWGQKVKVTVGQICPKMHFLALFRSKYSLSLNSTLKFLPRKSFKLQYLYSMLLCRGRQVSVFAFGVVGRHWSPTPPPVWNRHRIQKLSSTLVAHVGEGIIVDGVVTTI